MVTVTAEPGTTVALNLDNHYEKGKELPFTGAQGTLMIGGFAGILLLAGAAFVLIRRRGAAS